MVCTLLPVKAQASIVSDHGSHANQTGDVMPSSQGDYDCYWKLNCSWLLVVQLFDVGQQ